LPSLIHVLLDMSKYRDPRDLDMTGIKILNMDILASLGVKTLQFQCGVIGSTGENVYDSIVQFNNIEFIENKKKGFNKVAVVHTPSRDKVVYFETIDLRQHNFMSKCTCFTGDTLIPLLDGYSVPIKDLVGKEEFFVYSFDLVSKKIVIGKGYNCELKEKDALLIEVELDNGEKIKCTLDHKFLLKNGIYKEAKDLKEGDSLEAVYRKLNIKEDKLKGYEQVLQKEGWEFTHRLADSYKSLIKQAEVRHHIDFNKLNNNPNNIKIMNYASHRKLHQLRMIGDNNPMKNKKTVLKVKQTKIKNNDSIKASVRMKLNNPMKNKETVLKVSKTRLSMELKVSQETKNKIVKTSIERGNYIRNGLIRKELIRLGLFNIFNSLNAMIRKNKEQILNGIHYFQTLEHSAQVKQRNQINWSLGVHPFQNKEFKEKQRLMKSKELSNFEVQLKMAKAKTISYIRKIIMENQEFKEEYYKPKVGFWPLKKVKEYFNLEDLKKEATNHKVKKITFLKQKEDVYCFTVDKYNNFMIDVENGSPQSSGVIVHNCQSYRFEYEYQNALSGRLKRVNIGSPRKYQRKTPPSIRPANPKNPNPLGHDFVNPGNRHGICKHIFYILHSLKRNGYIVE